MPENTNCFTVALCGAPNCGKTTLFNLLTGQTQRTGNWPGVTVSYTLGTVQKRFLPDESDTALLLADLPGACALSPHSPEEKVTLQFLQQRKPDAVICVINACAPAQGLSLALQVMTLGMPMLLAFSMLDALKAKNGQMNAALISKKLGLPAMNISARSGENVHKLIHETIALCREKTAPGIRLPFMPDAVFSQHALHAAQRYQLIDEILSVAFFAGDPQKKDVTLKIDRIALHRFFSWPILLLLLFFVFFCVFGVPGQRLSAFFSGISEAAIAMADTLMQNAQTPSMIRSLLIDGIFQGVATVLGFLPTLLLFFALTAILEDSGYLARVAFILDVFLRRLGLSGRSFFPLITGFGCTVPAIMATRTLNGERDRTLTKLLVPYLPCGAKMPVILFLSSLIFPGKSIFCVLIIYILCLAAAALLSFPLCCLSGNALSPLVMELPAYRLPSLRSVWRVMRDKTRDFMSRAFTVVFFTSMLIWFLQYFTPDFRPSTQVDSSLLYHISAALSPVFSPLGFSSPYAVAALIAGLMAKENILSVLLLAPNVHTLFSSRASALSFLVFSALYTPCLAACAVLSREFKSRRRMLFAVSLQTAVAWLAAFGTYCIFS